MIDTILNSFDIWSDAQGVKSKGRVKSIENISLEGIERLRELILHLAVWGKLVPQDITERNADSVLDDIRTERINLVKSGKLKTLFKIPNLTADKTKINLPIGWAWAFIPQVLKNDKYSVKEGPFGSAIRKSFFVSKGYKVYEQQNAIYDDFSLGSYYINDDKFNELSAFEVRPNDLIISCSGTVGKVAIAPAWMEKGIINQALLKLTLNEKALTNEYFKILFQSYYLNTQTLQNLKGTAQKNMVSVKTLKNEPFPLPPPEEQKRIVAKVDELMVLCDKLEQERETNLKTHHLLVKTILSALTQANDANEFQTAWERMSTHFDTLFCTEDSIEQLKETILQLGVMGKLVKQDPDEEPAEVLLEKIALLNDDLIKKGEIRKKKPLPAITHEEKTFKIANGWSWIRLASIAEVRGGKRLPKGHSFSFNKTSHIYIQVTNMKNGTIINNDLKFISKETQQVISKYIIEKDDLYITIAGTIGEVGLVPDFFDGHNLTENAARIIFPNSYIYKFWLQKTLNSKYVQVQFEDKTNQVAQPKLALHRILSSCIAIPPLEEQKRISDKIDNLFAICDSISNRLIESQKLKGLLSQTIVEKAL